MTNAKRGLSILLGGQPHDYSADYESRLDAELALLWKLEKELPDPPLASTHIRQLLGKDIHALVLSSDVDEESVKAIGEHIRAITENERKQCIRLLADAMSEIDLEAFHYVYPFVEKVSARIDARGK